MGDEKPTVAEDMEAMRKAHEKMLELHAIKTAKPLFALADELLREMESEPRPAHLRRPRA